MSFNKLKKAMAIALTATMLSGTIVSAAPSPLAALETKETVAEENSISLAGDTQVSPEDEGVFQVEFDNTGKITASSADDKAKRPFSWDNATVYFVMTDRFYNGDKTNDHSYGRSGTSSTVPSEYKSTFEKIAGNAAATGEKGASSYESRKGTFHGGDLKGMTQKIEEGYFDDLGVNALWITAPYEQIHGAMSADYGGKGYKHYPYHGYWALDFTNVDANMGTAADLKELMTKAHEHGIRVIFDIVMNHAGYADPYTAAEYGVGTNTLSKNWGDTYFGKDEGEYTWKDDYATYGGMMNSTGWLTGWWGTSWVRMVKNNKDDGTDRFSEYDGSESSGGDLQICTSGLPDFKTESGAVSLPDILTNKWKAEGNYDAKVAMTEKSLSAAGLSEKSVSNYLVAWLSEWVREYGVDGFRCDTAKHIELSNWDKLYQACNKALAEWRTNNPNEPGADWKDEFWMTGEAWGWSKMSKDDYFTKGGFTSMINFGFQKTETKTGAALDSIFTGYADAINKTEGFNVLSYFSSHDKGVGARSASAGTALLLVPGGAQIYYGDESGRSGGAQYAEGDPESRSQMNWSSTDKAILSNWQKVGQFRRNHIAVGAGTHTKLASEPYTFSRTYEGTVQGAAYSDKVVVALPTKQGTFDISVGDVFEDGTVLRDAYASTGATEDVTYTVSGGKVEGVTCDSNGVILLEIPANATPSTKGSVSATPGAKTYDTDVVEITLNAKNAKDTYYQIGDDEKVAYKDGDKITIGGDTAYEEATKITLTGVGTEEGEALSKEVVYTRSKEPSISVGGSKFMLRVKKSDFAEAPSIWVWSGKTNYCGGAAWPGATMKESGEYYVFENDEITGEVSFIISSGTYRNTQEGETELTAKGTMDFDKATNTVKEFIIPSGKASKVTINYVDQATEKVLKTIYRVGVEGAAYKTYPTTLKGYKLVETPKDAEGKFAAEETTVTYLYVAGDAPIVTPDPTVVPTEAPTAGPGETPAPTAVPTEAPTAKPGETPAPTAVPTEAPTAKPGETPAPTAVPTIVPTTAPTAVPVLLASAKTSPSKKQTAGGKVKITAGATGGSGSYQYKVEVENKSGVVTTLQKYKANKVVSWEPKKAGTYTIYVYAKDKVTGKVTTKEVSYKIVSAELLASKLTVVRSGKLKVKLKAYATGGTGTVKYKFVVKPSKGKAITIQKYKAKNSLTWKAKKAGTYKFYAYVKDGGNTSYKLVKTFKVKKK